MSAVILVTGASTGIGRLTARTLAKAGHVVYAGMRDLQGRNGGHVREIEEEAASQRVELRPVELDVLSQESADRAVQTILADRGRLDVVVHNAGHLVVGPTEAFTAEEILKVLDTNLLGTQRVNRAALPHLRAREAGLLVWVSSTTARGGFPPFLGPYAAAKAAMDSLAQTVAYEVARFGIETSIVVPGAFTRGTSHFPNAGHPTDTATAAAYARYDGVSDQVAERLTALTPPNADPQAVADEIARIVGLAPGTRPFRSVIDFVGDGAEEVTAVAERVRIEFAHRIGIADLLRPSRISRTSA